MNDGLVVAFTAGSVMGFAVVGLGITGRVSYMGITGREGFSFCVWHFCQWRDHDTVRWWSDGDQMVVRWSSDGGQMMVRWWSDDGEMMVRWWSDGG